MKKRIIPVILTALFYTTFLYAEAVTDGTVGAVQNLSGQFTVPASLGTISGTNLFHSFKTFNINSGESATFTGSDSILNVISRVTGDEVSNINGVLRSQVGKADFYFINPAGIVFGKEAKLDIPASFYVTTSNGLRFKDGLIYSATDTQNNQLSISPPEQFGLLTAISSNNNYIEIDGAKLNLNDKQTLGLSSGSIVIQNNASMNAPEGEINLITPETSGKIQIANIHNFNVDGNGAGLVSIKAQDVELKNSIVSSSNLGTNNSTGGIIINANTLSLTQSNIMVNSVDTGNGGDVTINANSIALNNSVISTDTKSSGSGGSIHINKSNSVNIKDGSKITANTSDVGNAGGIDINAKSVQLSKSSIISSDTYDNGLGGVINILADTVTAQEGGKISVTSYSKGAAGSVNLNAQNINFDGKGINDITGVMANARKSGNAGKVDINANMLKIIDGAVITSSTFGSGNAKSVSVNAQTMIIDGKDNNFEQTGIGSNANPDSSGQAGNVLISANQVNLLHGGEITSQTFGTGNAGNLQVNAKELINIDGQNANSATGIGTDTNSTGNGGVININTRELTIKNTGSVGSNTSSLGNAGAVNIDVTSLNIDGTGSVDTSFTGISSNALKETGNAGNVNVNARNININEKGRIESNTWSHGNGGLVNVKTDKLMIDGNNSGTYTGVASNAYEQSQGNAGNVTVEAKNIYLTNAGRITTNTRGEGAAGNLVIKADNIDIDAKHSQYLAVIASAASPDSFGQTGNIDITANNHLNLSNAAQISIQSRANVKDSNVLTTGNISIATPILNIDDALINAKATENTNASNINLHITNALQMNLGSISTQANSGNGGVISVDSGNYMDLHHSSITTSVASSVGNGGNITVSSPALVLDNGMVQANAYSGHGGDVYIKVDSLIGSQNALLQGGEKPVVWQSDVSGFNVIQAASQFGLSGTVNVTSPQMNLSGVLIGLSTSNFGRDILSQDYCNAGVGSSLTVLGHGALPSKSTDLLY